jgi:3D (Asp-Asp-Asp) domain-containing protein
MSVATSVSATPSATVSKFNGRPVRAIGTKRMLVTAYCPCAKCCGKHANGITAAGYSVWTNRGKLVAADTRILPFGSLISVPGYDDDQVVPVLDRGGKIKGHRLDLLYPTHREAKKWGARWLNVTVYEFVQ